MGVTLNPVSRMSPLLVSLILVIIASFAETNSKYALVETNGKNSDHTDNSDYRILKKEKSCSGSPMRRRCRARKPRWTYSEGKGCVQIRGFGEEQTCILLNRIVRPIVEDKVDL